MKWIKSMAVSLTVAALTATCFGESFYRAGEFSIDSFGTVRTSDFDNERTGLGVGVNYFLTRQVGIGIEGSSENTSGAFVDAARVNFIYRIPIQRTAPYLFVGGGRNFDIPGGETSNPDPVCDPGWPCRKSGHDSDEEWAMNFGVGIEHRFRKNFGVFIDARLDKVIDRDAAAVGRAGIRINF